MNGAEPCWLCNGNAGANSRKRLKLHGSGSSNAQFRSLLQEFAPSPLESLSSPNSVLCQGCVSELRMVCNARRKIDDLKSKLLKKIQYNAGIPNPKRVCPCPPLSSRLPPPGSSASSTTSPPVPNDVGSPRVQVM